MRSSPFLVAAMVVLGAGRARADDCQNVISGPELKILIQDFLGPTTDASMLRERLLWEMQVSVEQLKADPSTQYLVIACTATDQSIDNFTEEQARALHEREVLVELRPVLESSVLDGGAGKESIGYMKYASIPVVRFRSELPTLPRLMRRKLVLASGPGDFQTRLTSLLVGGALLQGYVAMSSAVRAYKLKEYEAAFAGFCSAKRKVDEASVLTGMLLTQPPMDLTALGTRLTELAKESFRRSKQSDRANALKSMPAPTTGDPCVP